MVKLIHITCGMMCTEIVMRTNIVLDEQLVAKGMQITGLKTRRALVDFALRELIRHRHQRAILKLRGQVKWEGDLYRMRKGRLVNDLG
jgi:Arc/MetJ family transcription regulator